MGILWQATLENSSSLPAHYVIHLLRDLFHSLGLGTGSDHSAWGLGRWRRLLTSTVIPSPTCFLNQMDYLIEGGLKWRSEIHQCLNCSPSFYWHKIFSSDVHFVANSPKDDHPTFWMQGRAPSPDTNTQGVRGTHRTTKSVLLFHLVLFF